MDTTAVSAIVMAGGRGVRMRSPQTKMLMEILGKPLVAFPVELALQSVGGKVVVVSGEALDDIRDALQSRLPSERMEFARQAKPLGTADAARAGMSRVIEEHVLVLNGDVPGMSSALVDRLFDAYSAPGVGLAFITFRADDPTGYGRVIFDDSGVVLAIREEKELHAFERSLKLVNAGVYLLSSQRLRGFLEQVERSPNQQEYLLTDIVSHVVKCGETAEIVTTADPGEVTGVNNRAELADATRRIRTARNRELMVSGVTMPFPDTVEVEFWVEIGPNTHIDAGVALRGKTRVGSHCRIGRGTVVVDCQIGDYVRVLPYCMLEDSRIRLGCSVGPFAHTRPGTVLEQNAKVGNFVETKKTTLGAGSKANHLSYLGDAEIGPHVNVGAGTITCNYDGVNKYRIVLEEGVFVGSDTQLVAPVRVGRDAVIAAGTTVTSDVPPGALCISRVEQVNRLGYAEKKKAAREAKKDNAED